MEIILYFVVAIIGFMIGVLVSSTGRFDDDNEDSSCNDK